MNLKPAMAMAFGTASSAATLPVTMKCAEVNGVSEPVRNFVFPLGATVGTGFGRVIVPEMEAPSLLESSVNPV
jgi:Na+/H+-dicarboxylate symporter